MCEAVFEQLRKSIARGRHPGPRIRAWVFERRRRALVGMKHISTDEFFLLPLEGFSMPSIDKQVEG